MKKREQNRTTTTKRKPNSRGMLRERAKEEKKENEHIETRLSPPSFYERKKIK